MRAAWIALGLVAPAAAAFACGVCREDKMAATYDASVIAAARAHGHAVGFVALAGKGVPIAAGAQRTVARAFAGVPGVDPGTVRVSAGHAAASFAFDPSRHTLASLLGVARPRLSRVGLTADSISVLVGPPGHSSAKASAGTAGTAATSMTLARRSASFGHQAGPSGSR
jgi:hypothetical protein